MTLEHRHAILDALMTVLSEEHAEGVIEHRKRTIKKPFTVFAAKLLAKEFGKCPDANAAAEEMILRGWQGFKAEWMAKVQPVAAYRQSARSANAEMNSMLFAEEPAYGHQIEHDAYLLDFTGSRH